MVVAWLEIIGRYVPLRRLGWMQDLHLGARVRAVRVRLRLRQRDVAARAAVSDATVSRIERGHLDTLSLRTLRAVADVLEIRVDLQPRWRGGDLERLVSARHAALAEAAIRHLDADAWLIRPEVSFAIYAERGVVDLLAWHATTRTLLVVELKTEIVDVGELLGTLDRKVRLAPEVTERFGWKPVTVGRCLMVADGSTNRRRIERFEGTFRAALPGRGPAVSRWLREPQGALRGLLFVSDRHAQTTGRDPEVRKRVRVTPGIRGVGSVPSGERATTPARASAPPPRMPQP